MPLVTFFRVEKRKHDETLTRVVSFELKNIKLRNFLHFKMLQFLRVFLINLTTLTQSYFFHNPIKPFIAKEIFLTLEYKISYLTL